MNPGRSSRLNKELHPDRYCPNPKCLWYIGTGKPCPKHMLSVVTTVTHTDTAEDAPDAA